MGTVIGIMEKLAVHGLNTVNTGEISFLEQGEATFVLLFLKVRYFTFTYI